MKLKLEDFITQPAVNVSDMEYEDKLKYVTDVAAHVWFEENPPTPPTPVPANNEIWYWGEYYDIENAISVLGQQDMPYAGPAILSNEQVGDKYVITFDGPVTKLGIDGIVGGTVRLYPAFINYPEIGVTCNITSIEIPNSVTSIRESAFIGCSGLSSVTIPNSVTSIGTYAFEGCSGLVSIIVENENPVYDSRNNCNAIIETETNTLIVGCKVTVIPNMIKVIGTYAFEGCSGLTSITIPNSVTRIREGAFIGCYSLTSVTIPNSVTSIGQYAFSDCYSLTSVTIGNSVTTIGESAFMNCSGLSSVTIPNSVTSIGGAAFSSCSDLTSITCEATTPPILGNSDVFEYTNECPIYVPSQSVNAYKTSWSEYADRIQAIPG